MLVIRKGNLSREKKEKQIDLELKDLKATQEYIAMMTDVDIDEEEENEAQ